MKLLKTAASLPSDDPGNILDLHTKEASLAVGIEVLVEVGLHCLYHAFVFVFAFRKDGEIE